MTPQADAQWTAMTLPSEVQDLLRRAPSIIIPRERAELIELALGGSATRRGGDQYIVSYEIPGTGKIDAAEVIRCKNGVAVNYYDPYLRRRDPDCMVIADDSPTDKPHYAERFTEPFPELRQEIMDWLAEQELIVLPFFSGDNQLGLDSLLIAPKNAGFFACALADLQGLIPRHEIPPDFAPRAIIYLAPPFRHTHCDGRQVVIHNRLQNLHELFSLNLYPGPSAKKGIYGVLLSIGEKEGFITLHGSTVQVVTPYDNILSIMHEGASGGGKSEMLEYAHREPDGRLLVGTNVQTGQKRFIELGRACSLRPVTDDMALTHPALQGDNRKLVVTDAEEAWFLRINHITHYGVDPIYERLTIHPPEPLLFLNIDAVPNATCLIWEHKEDSPGKRCPNPRVIIPRRMVPEIVTGPSEVDIRSFGVRTPPCSAKNPSYGILGLLHLIPPALGWLWRLVSPRGHDNPSITSSAGMSAESVGSYWPFATGRRIDQANLLLRQIVGTPSTRYALIPNQHVGVWSVGFMPQWIAREYLARRGVSRYKPDQLVPARCPLLGWALSSMQIEGTPIYTWLLQVDTQPEVGPAAYDAGAEELTNFFHSELLQFLTPDLDPLGTRIIECFLQGGKVEDYAALLTGGELFEQNTLRIDKSKLNRTRKGKAVKLTGEFN